LLCLTNYNEYSKLTVAFKWNEEMRL